MTRIDDLSAWRYFVAFARAGTLTGAAQSLQVETSNVSRAIAALEKALGTELVRHNTRPLEFTEAGLTALRRIEPIIRAHESLVSSIMNDNRSLEGKIRLSSAPGFAARRLTPILQRFHQSYPNITVEIIVGLKEAEVQKGLCDIATLTGEPTMPGLVYMSRGRNVFLPVASPDYIRRNGMPFHPDQLRSHTGYVYAGPVRSETKELVRCGKAEPIVYGTAIRSTDVLAVRQAVLDGMGIAVDLPLVQISEDLLQGRLVPILPGWFRPPVECFNVTTRSAWHMKRVRVFFEWYSRELQAAFAKFEDEASLIVGLPPDEHRLDRERIFRT